MVITDDLYAPSKSSSDYGEFIKLSAYSKILRLMSVLLILIFAISALIVPFGTVSIKLSDQSGEETLYENEYHYSVIDVWKANVNYLGNLDTPRETVEEDVRFLREKNPSAAQRADNLNIFIDKMGFVIEHRADALTEINYGKLSEDNFIDESSPDAARQREEFAKFKEEYKQALIEKDTTDLALFLKIFSEEIEVRNIDGINALISELNERYSYAFTNEEVKELQEKYLVGTYELDTETVQLLKRMSIPAVAATAPGKSEKNSWSSDEHDSFRASYVYYEHYEDSGEYERVNGAFLDDYTLSIAPMTIVSLYAIVRCIIRMVSVAIDLIFKREHLKSYGLSFITPILVLASLYLGNYFSNITEGVTVDNIVTSYSVTGLTVVGILVIASVVAIGICNKIVYKRAEAKAEKEAEE